MFPENLTGIEWFALLSATGIILFARDVALRYLCDLWDRRRSKND